MSKASREYKRFWKDYMVRVGFGKKAVSLKGYKEYKRRKKRTRKRMRKQYRIFVSKITATKGIGWQKEEAQRARREVRDEKKQTYFSSTNNV